MKRILIATVLALSSAAAFAYTGNELLSDLTDDSPTRRLQGLRYLVGMFDAMDASELMAKDKSGLVCLPAGTTRGQLRDMVLQTLRAKPEIRHDDAVVLVYGVMLSRFACPTSPKRMQGQAL